MIAYPRAPGIGHPVAQQAVRDAGADVQEHEPREVAPRAEQRLGASRGPHVAVDDDRPGRRERRRDVEVAPVERLRAPRPAQLIDELAQPEPDRRTLGRHDRRGLGTRRQRRRPIVRRRHDVPHQHLAGREIAQPGGDLRAADVDPDGEPASRQVAGRDADHRLGRACAVDAVLVLAAGRDEGTRPRGRARRRTPCRPARRAPRARRAARTAARRRRGDARSRPGPSPSRACAP